MYRASPEEVRSLLALLDSDTTDVTVFIGTANMLVTEELGATGLSDERLKQIEMYLAAHFGCIAIEKGGITRQKAGSSEDQYHLERPTKYNLSSTRYGQQAVSMDTSGKLSLLDSQGGIAEFRVMSPVPTTFNPDFPFTA